MMIHPRKMQRESPERGFPSTLSGVTTSHRDSIAQDILTRIQAGEARHNSGESKKGGVKTRWLSSPVPVRILP